MMSVSTSARARCAAPAMRCSPLQRLCAPATSSRGGVRVQSGLQEGLFVSDAFKEALQSALQRDGSSGAGMYSGGDSRESSYSRSEPSPAAYQRPTAPYVPQQPAQSSTSGPMLQILATALGQSRATLERLQAEEAEIENLIQRERKQVERLEWLLEKVQQDYAYFDQLQRRFEADSSGSNMRHENHGGYNSSGSSGGGYGYDSSSYNSSSSGGGGGGYGGGYESSAPSNGSSSSGGGGRFSNYY